MKNIYASPQVVTVVSLLGLVFLAILANAIVAWLTPSIRSFGPHQPRAVVEARYKACKQQAKEGWDCLMVPILVTEEFVKEHSK